MVALDGLRCPIGGTMRVKAAKEIQGGSRGVKMGHGDPLVALGGPKRVKAALDGSTSVKAGKAGPRRV